VPHGEGAATENRIEFRIPYSGWTFRDQLTYLPATQDWTLIIDAEKPGGELRHFAAYRLTRP
jgi:hypothetical protein